VITFTQPGFLALLALIPISVFIAWPRLRRGLRVDVAHAHAWAGLFLRSVLLACVALALAGAQSVTWTDRLAVVFLVDVSDSVGAAGRDRAATFIRESLKAMRAGGGALSRDQAAVVLFGADAQIERGMSSFRDLAPFSARVRAAGTNIENAIRLGLSLFPPDAAKRLVLISDGKQTTGDADTAARLARAVNVRLDVVPLQSIAGIDAAIQRVDAPQSASVGQIIPLEVVVRSNAAMQAQLTVFSGAEVVAQQPVSLVIGENTFSLRVNATQAGFSAFRVQLIPDVDTIPQNNALSASVIVGGKPRVLLVSNPPAPAPRGADPVRGAAGVDEIMALKAALTAADIDYDESAPGSMPAAIQSLAAYQSIILVNVPARDLSLRAMFSLQSYVRDIGGGLVVIGGPNSYGVGGYFRTPLEETLPVDTQVKDPRRFPSVAMAIVMDKSGSMSAQEGGVLKMRLAAEAAARAAELINDDDDITIIGYDTELVDQIGPFPGRDRQRFIPEILRIAPGGGGIYVYESLIEARRALSQSDKRSKFIILLADGSDAENQSGARELAQQMRAENITLSVVAIGDGSDVPFLKEIARIGGGRFHLTDQAANLPTIFTEETALAQRSYVVEQTVLPRAGASSPMLSGIEAVPALLGYIATTPKPAAQVILWANETDPLLAAWQYGLGRAVAFTSDATGRWARLWVAWDAFPKFWAQVARWTILERPDTTLQARVTQDGDLTTIIVDAPATRTESAETQAALDLNLQATLIDSAGNTQQVALSQVGPGRYEGQTWLTEPGAYFVRIESAASLTTTPVVTEAATTGGSTASTGSPAGGASTGSATGASTGSATGASTGSATGASTGSATGASTGSATGGSTGSPTGAADHIRTLAWVKPYSSEYIPGPSAEDALLAWAELGGGGVLAQPADAFRLDAPAAASRTDLFPWLLAIAACLLPFDIGVRRIAVSFRKLLGVVPRREMAAATLEQGGRISQLMQAKARGSRAPGTVALSQRRIVGAPVSTDSVRTGPRPADRADEIRDTQAPDAPATAGATASELLRRRRRQSADSSTGAGSTGAGSTGAGSTGAGSTGSPAGASTSSPADES